ncbi:DUF5304 domain-containing protein [Streptomyces sp. ME19-01-6]|uniref:DUF5304 domain-containing protein n=1 Tax=Streptomyces sp. ME19-01-6 TaxID=3028686 RepID=UPI0029A93D28|nr:DUF5304 domain-containing protein [Streptomyces sp. ME19-01-6]MDX3232050.1 DUF5304 domain-containing protein [Streptomyces sp. ME19-01-6]
MSDATERPAESPVTDVPVTDIDPDAWERACAEDLAAERGRRRAREGGHEPGSAAEELRKLAEAVADRLAGAQAPLAGTAVQGAVQHLIAQAKAAVEPVIERNPEVFDHLATAGTELLAAYRAAVQGQEQHWTRGDDSRAHKGDKGDKGDDEGGESSSSEHIDLD